MCIRDSCQLIANAPHRPQKLRRTGFGFQLLPQMPDMYPQTVLVAIIICAPDRRTKGIVGNDVSCLLYTSGKTGQLCPVRPLKNMLHPQQPFLHQQRLGQVAVSYTHLD